MGATKKRRQTKHRGNAAGMVEARGRTTPGRAGAPAGGGKGPRVPQPPTWRKAAIKAFLPVVILLPILIFTQKDSSAASIATLTCFAYLMYLPLSYWSDRFVYRRYLKQQGQL